MNVLIVGLGYAGTRFLRAFNNISSNTDENFSIKIAYVGKHRKQCDVPYFENIESALSRFQPMIVVVCVNDEFHAEILNKLRGFAGFIICEKPLVSAKDNLDLLINNLNGISGFCLDLIERYSEVTIALKTYVATHNLNLIRANFHWGKNRINDHRPTCGVTSEVIHALDLIQWICDPNEHIKLQGVLGSRSDFSISGTEVLDSVALTATLGRAVVTGYSSFVNIVRKREVELTFATPQKKLVYARMIFDTPVWDIDHLQIWERTRLGEHIIMDLHTELKESNSELKTIQKLVRLVSDVVGYMKNGSPPSQPFADLQTALSLQKILNAIEHNAKTSDPVQYGISSNRDYFNDGSDWERLG